MQWSYKLFGMFPANAGVEKQMEATASRDSVQLLRDPSRIGEGHLFSHNLASPVRHGQHPWGGFYMASAEKPTQ